MTSIVSAKKISISKGRAEEDLLLNLLLNRENTRRSALVPHTLH